jgi:hypothetical protein
MTNSIRYFSNCACFVVHSNYFERMGLVIFVFHVFIINKQATCCKSAMPYDYPPQVIILVGNLTKAKFWLNSNTI